MGALRPGRRMGQRLDRACVRMGADMKIEAGKYYRTRDGDVVGPMRPERGNTRFCWETGLSSWAATGGFSEDCEDHDMDLISEVYVSDTPQVNTTKTARDELVEKAALAILNGHYANPSPMSSYGFAEIWLAAEHFVEARQK